MAKEILRVSELSIDYLTRRGSVHAVDHFDLSIEEGEVIGLVGESGTGKSSAALGLMGLVRRPGKVTGGSVSFGGTDLLGLSDAQMQRVRGNDISLIMQNPRSALNPMLRVGDQISDVIRAHSDMDKKRARARVLEMLRLVGINDPERRYNAYPHELSGGMAQRVLIATALSNTPTLLIADEPTSGLDVTIQAQILDDLARSVSETGSAAIIVTQDLGLVANYCDRIVVMYAGQVVEQAAVLDFFDHPAHPASRALLSASQKSASDRLVGPATQRLDDVPGCLLHQRCPWNDGAECVSARQLLLEVGATHVVRCHRWAELGVPVVPHAVTAGAADE